ncbi:MAG: histidinol-phosphate transaminase [Bdellovibrionales bacterium]|nr:histidinol-phosphate transaminase [Bdellovibrionales bacterium]
MSSDLIARLLRPDLRDFTPYSSARDESDGMRQSIRLDANEMPTSGLTAYTDLNRYPDGSNTELRSAYARLLGVSTESVFAGNGSDEAIKLLIEGFCRPGIDQIFVLQPSYGMYQVAADICGVASERFPLDAKFEPPFDRMLEAKNSATKICFICSPNNPTGNCFMRCSLEQLITNFGGLVVIDEAYIEFAREKSTVELIQSYPNLVVLRTLSKAWGLAGLRVGFAVADSAVISLLQRIKAPYNLNCISQTLALEALRRVDETKRRVKDLIREREDLRSSLKGFSFVLEVYPSEANFLLVRCDSAARLYEFLRSRGALVRNRSKEYGCDNCLRITIGSAQENSQLVENLLEYEKTRGLL